jgi:hypothetical protein
MGQHDQGLRKWFGPPHAAVNERHGGRQRYDPLPTNRLKIVFPVK